MEHKNNPACTNRPNERMWFRLSVMWCIVVAFGVHRMCAEIETVSPGTSHAIAKHLCEYIASVDI